MSRQTVSLTGKQRHPVAALRPGRRGTRVTGDRTQLDRRPSGRVDGLGKRRSHGHAVHPSDTNATPPGDVSGGRGPDSRPRSAGAPWADEAQQDREEDDRVENSEHEDEDHCLVERDEDVRVAESHDQRRQ